jgi:hypothetical protein
VSRRVGAARRAAGALPALVLLLTGCAAVPVGSPDGLPACGHGDVPPANGVVLLAQSVPTASWVPCLRESAMPMGWRFAGMDADRGRATVRLDSDRAGRQALVVTLTGSCDVDGATEVPTDHPGMRRFERVHQVTPRFEGERSYRFAGGCLTVTLSVGGADRVEPLAVAATVIDVVPRSRVQQLVREQTGGRLSLDPDGGGP